MRGVELIRQLNQTSTLLIAHNSSLKIMARGWESKAVEDQVQEAEERARLAERASLLPDSPEERARLEKLESLKLSRTRTLDQLERATRPAHREMLQRTLAALEREIEDSGG